MDQLYKCPEVFPAEDFESEGVKALYFSGPKFKGKSTGVFVWIGIPEQANETNKVPAVVLVHGGGGTAYSQWVRIWNRRGYAAIAVSTTAKSGCETECPQQKEIELHQWAGPSEEQRFELTDLEPCDQWAYHAVADVIMGCSLLRSYPQIDNDKIGICGVSWGGTIACIVSSIDKRFKCAVSAYGCGFIPKESRIFIDKGDKLNKRWSELWDPSQYLELNDTPIFWFTGTNDQAYSLETLKKSYELVKGDLTLRFDSQLAHGHIHAWAVKEQYAFVDSYLKATEPLIKITGQHLKKNRLTVRYESSVPLESAELLFTAESSQPSYGREWKSSELKVDVPGRVDVVIPDQLTVCCVNLIDVRGLSVSSRLEYPAGEE